MRVRFKFEHRWYNLEVPEEWGTLYEVNGIRLRLKIKCSWCLAGMEDIGLPSDFDIKILDKRSMYSILELIYVTVKYSFKVDGDEYCLRRMMNGGYDYDNFLYGVIGSGGSKIYEDTLRRYYGIYV